MANMVPQQMCFLHLGLTAVHPNICLHLQLPNLFNDAYSVQELHEASRLQRYSLSCNKGKAGSGMRKVMLSMYDRSS